MHDVIFEHALMSQSRSETSTGTNTVQLCNCREIANLVLAISRQTVAKLCVGKLNVGKLLIAHTNYYATTSKKQIGIQKTIRLQTHI